MKKTALYSLVKQKLTAKKGARRFVAPKESAEERKRLLDRIPSYLNRPGINVYASTLLKEWPARSLEELPTKLLKTIEKYGVGFFSGGGENRLI